MRKILLLSFYTIAIFILLIITNIASAQEITGWISPSDLFTDSKWLKFFNKVVVTESIGGNAGENSFGVNFYVNHKTGLVPLYNKRGVNVPLVGNIQDLPRKLFEDPRLAGVTARIEIVDWRTGKNTMTEIFKGKQALSPTANRELLKGIVRYNLDPRNLGEVTKVIVPLKSAVAPKSPKIGLFEKLAQSKIGRTFGFGLRGFGYIGIYYQLKNITEGTFEGQETPPGTTIILPPKVRQPNLNPIINTFGLPSHIKVEGDNAYYFDSVKYDWVRAANPELAERIKEAVKKRTAN
mgnify:FL=1